MAASMVLTACSAPQAPAQPAAATQPPAQPAAATQPPAAAAPTKAAAQYKCALITPNPLGDRSFIDASARGIKKANEDLPVKCDIIETNGVSEHETALRGAIAQGYDLILGLAMDTDMFMKLAAEFPNQKFASPSEIFLDKLPDNVSAYQIDVHESSYLVGLIVGSLTKTKKVGAVLGGDSPWPEPVLLWLQAGCEEGLPGLRSHGQLPRFRFRQPNARPRNCLRAVRQGRRHHLPGGRTFG